MIYIQIINIIVQTKPTLPYIILPGRIRPTQKLYNTFYYFVYKEHKYSPLMCLLVAILHEAIRFKYTLEHVIVEYSI